MRLRAIISPPAAVEADILAVPIYKDDTDLAGHPTAFGCEGEFPPATEDAELVRRLKHAGAVIVGKTHSSELGQWPLTGTAANGYTRNPWARTNCTTLSAEEVVVRPDFGS